MKITMNVDCTPEEARAFFGLPDVQPLQEEMLKLMRAKMLESAKIMEPERLMQMWAPMMNQGASQMNEFFKAVVTGAASGAKKAAKK